MVMGIEMVMEIEIEMGMGMGMVTVTVIVLTLSPSPAVLSHRICNLLQNNDVKAHEILALTFTDEAARSLQSRVASTLSATQYGDGAPWMGMGMGLGGVMNHHPAVDDMTIATFHGLCREILTEFSVESGLDMDQFRVLNPAQELMFFRQHMHELPFKSYKTNAAHKSLLKLINILHDFDISPQVYPAHNPHLHLHLHPHPHHPHPHLHRYPHPIPAAMHSVLWHIVH